MKHSQLAMLIANIWIVISFLATDYNRIWMIVFGVAWLIGAFVVGDYEKKKQLEEEESNKVKIVEPGDHSKRFYIEEGKIIDRMERRVEGFEEVKN